MQQHGHLGPSRVSGRPVTAPQSGGRLWVHAS